MSRSREQIEADFKKWLAEGGEEKMRKALARAKQTSENFTKIIRGHWSDLYIPVDF